MGTCDERENAPFLHARCADSSLSFHPETTIPSAARNSTTTTSTITTTTSKMTSLHLRSNHRRLDPRPRRDQEDDIARMFAKRMKGDERVKVCNQLLQSHVGSASAGNKKNNENNEPAP